MARNASSLRRRCRRACAPALECSVDDRRWQWTTYSNLNTWFDGWKAFLLHHGFAEDKPEEQPESDGRTAEVRIPPQKKRRILNSDETHHTLDNEGDRGGSRSRTYVSKKSGRSGTRHVKATGHVTGLYTTTAGGQNGPPFYFFSTDAENPENYKVGGAHMMRVGSLTWKESRIIGNDASSHKTVPQKLDA